MGSFMIFDVEFQTKKDRLRFEEYLKKKYIQQAKLTNYHEEGKYRQHLVVYYAGYLGYAEPEMILEACLRRKIRITFMAWLPISDRGTKWTKIKGRWE